MSRVRQYGSQRVGFTLNQWIGVTSNLTVVNTKEPSSAASSLIPLAATVPIKGSRDSSSPISGVGVLSTQDLNAMGYTKPDDPARYTGGVIGKAPKEAKGQKTKPLQVNGAPLLSQPTQDVVE